jgi:hypothetical protein
MLQGGGCANSEAMVRQIPFEARARKEAGEGADQKPAEDNRIFANTGASANTATFQLAVYDGNLNPKDGTAADNDVLFDFKRADNGDAFPNGNMRSDGHPA